MITPTTFILIDPVPFVCFSQIGVEARGEGGEGDVRRLRGDALQHPLGVSEVWLCCLLGLLQGQRKKELQRSVVCSGPRSFTGILARTHITGSQRTHCYRSARRKLHVNGCVEDLFCCYLFFCIGLVQVPRFLVSGTTEPLGQSMDVTPSNMKLTKTAVTIFKYS